MSEALFALAVLLFGLGLFVIFRLCDLSAQTAHEAEEVERFWRERAECRKANPTDESSTGPKAA